MSKCVQCNKREGVQEFTRNSKDFIGKPVPTVCEKCYKDIIKEDRKPSEVRP